jgi:hypothetical protein
MVGDETIGTRGSVIGVDGPDDHTELLANLQGKSFSNRSALRVFGVVERPGGFA